MISDPTVIAVFRLAIAEVVQMMDVIWWEAVHLIGGKMSPETIFNLHLILGYVAWLLCFGVYVMPRLESMDQVAAQRAIATLHSFRFFGLVFILPGVVGPNLPVAGSLYRYRGKPHTNLLPSRLASCMPEAHAVQGDR
jgi:hypothetical protein